MSWLRNNIVAIHAALVVSVFAWLWGGMRGSALVPVMPWIVALLAESMLFFPQRRGEDESTYQARERVWRQMCKDPLVWIEAVFLILMVIPFVNAGLCPGCDAAAIAAGADPKPLVSFLPYCVSRLHHLSVFLWFLPTLTAVTAIRHALCKSGKRLFCEIVVWNAALLAVYGFVQEVAGAPGPLWWVPAKQPAVYFFSTFGYPNAGGCFFTAAFSLSVAVWRWREETVREEHAERQAQHAESRHQYFWHKHYMVMPSLVLFFAAINTLSRAAIAIVCAAAGLLLVHAAVSTLARMSKTRRVKSAAWMLLFVIGLAIFVSTFTPERVRREMGTLHGSTEALDRFTSKTSYHSRVALDLLWEHPFFGCGGWGYVHLSPTKMTESEMAPVRARWSFGSANVHNDYLQFLTEHGFIGFACLAGIAVMLLIGPCRVWAMLYKAARFTTDKKKRPARPVAIFAFPAGGFAVLISVLGIFVHGFLDCPLRSPAVLSLFFCELAALDGFLPRLDKEHEKE